MINLTLTTDKLQVINATTSTIDVHASYMDVNTSTSAVTPGRTNTAITTAATNDVVPVPGATTTRNVKTLHIRNKDASIASDVTVQFNQNGTLFELHKVNLLAGETLEYIEGIGFFKISNTALYRAMRYVSSNSVHATAATFAAITDLNFTVLSGHNYTFMCALAAITNATTTGAQFGVGGVAATYVIASGFSVLLGSPTASATITSGTVTAVDTAVMAQTTGAAANQPHIFWGLITPSASGTLSIKATSEVTVAAGLTVLKGSWASIQETDN